MKHIPLLSLLVVPSSLVFAQTASQTAIDRSQQTLAPSVAPAGNARIPIAPGDADAGTQRIAEPRKLPVKLSLAYDFQVYYANNVRLVPSGVAREDAYIMANTLALRGEFKSMAVGKDGLLTPTVGFNVQRFYHGIGDGRDFEDLDFDSFSVPLTLRYRFGSNWEAGFTLNSSVVYNINGSSNYHQIFSSYAPSLSIRKLIGFGQNNILSLGSGVGYSFTRSDRDGVATGFVPFRSDRNDKLDVSLDAAYYYLFGKWVFGPYARLGYSDYTHYQEAGFGAASDVNRRDINGSAGFSVVYNFTPSATGRIFGSRDWRNSQEGSGNDYGYLNTNAGVGATLSLEF